MTVATAAKENEMETIRRAQEGDEDAFGTLFCAYKHKVFCLCLRMTGDRTKTEDLTQETFMQLFRKIHTFRGEALFSTWLHRMTVNTVLMNVRKRGLSEISLEEILKLETEEGVIHRELGASDAVLAHSTDRLLLERIVRAMSPGYRTVFILHDIEGYQHNEIAAMIGCSVGNSKSQLFKARVWARKCIENLEVLRTVEARKLRALNRNHRGTKPKHLVTMAMTATSRR